jgi:hypothetical protein
MSVALDANIWVGGRVEDHAITKALAARASTAVLRKSQRKERLLLQADAAGRKKLQQTRMLENTSKKRSRDKETIARYFTSTRNFDLAATTEKGSVPSETSLTTNSIGVHADTLTVDSRRSLIGKMCEWVAQW